MMMRPNHGTRHTPRAVRTEGARKLIFAARAETDCCIVSQLTSSADKISKSDAGKSVDGPRLAGVYCFFTTGRAPSCAPGNLIQVIHALPALLLARNSRAG